MNYIVAAKDIIKEIFKSRWKVKEEERWQQHVFSVCCGSMFM
jgi:hypothetical protein